MESRITKNFNDRFDDINSKLTGRVSKVEEDMGDFRKSVEFVCGEIEDIKKITLPSIENKLLERIDFLEKKLQYSEHRSRKYNLLFCGIPQSSDKEDTSQVVRRYMLEKLKLEEGRVDDLIIANCHRVPIREPEKTGVVGGDPKDPKDTRPPNIVIKFTIMAQRNMVFAAVTNLKGSTERFSVRSDICSHLKKRRSELAQIAYTLRRDEKLQTAIRETPHSVWLVTRRHKKDDWVEYK